MIFLPGQILSREFYQKCFSDSQYPIRSTKETVWSFTTCLLAVVCLLLIFITQSDSAQKLISPLIAQFQSLHSLKEGKEGKEVFGFAPHWTFHKLDNVDFNVLTTLAYFGVPVNSDGTLDTKDRGYEVFKSERATEVFKRAHAHGTRVVLTITQMNNASIRAILDDPKAQKRTIDQTVTLVKTRGIDGVNVDFEYVGDPGSSYRQAFTRFVENMSTRMHREVPSSKVTVSVYASAIKDPKIYDIGGVAQASDGVFMMAYDYATTSSDHAIPTSPLYGYKEGRYWYDVSTAVDDFLTQMPAEKLILGVPWYGYNYAVYSPTTKAEVNPGYYTYYWYRRRQYSEFHPYKSMAQTYTIAQNHIDEGNPQITNIVSGWDEYGQVGWKAYQEDGVWRMIFLEDEKSLGLKYDFAKGKNLLGVGMWALGLDDGKVELWALLRQKFGTKLADSGVTQRVIQ